jgi:lipopolysaccharide/colanic/teichoic acid biosynthesis glycosyltransferase
VISAVLKRLVDIISSAVALVVLLPVFAVLAITIKLDTAGPAFYRGIRIGRFGRQFCILKFRTLVANAEEVGGACTADDDIRITRVGRFLRKYKLDELPQLLNVLVGSMSLVGPRPEVKKYVDLFNEDEKAILTVRPGITDWATLWDSDEGAVLAGSPDPEQTYLEKIRPEKIRLQLEYISKQSFWVDIRILFTTFSLVVKRLVGVRARNSTGGKGSARGVL